MPTYLKTASETDTCPRCGLEMPADFAEKHHDLKCCRDRADLQPLYAEAIIIFRGEGEEDNAFDWQYLTESINELIGLHGFRIPGELVDVQVEAITPEDERFGECEKLNKQKQRETKEVPASSPQE
ncbi:MAG: hypothetical protein FVQ81_02005 [Candidatus Glassbacteria bacterium]|nr:hypothetical protein [Candidatus Glassbacteria bacterium]